MDALKYLVNALFYTNWVSSNLIFIKDIINQRGEIDPYLIYNKLNNKRNHIAETNNIVDAIPRSWQRKLKSESSIKSKVKTALKLTIGKKEISLTSNKYIYQYLVKQKFITSCDHRC